MQLILSIQILMLDKVLNKISQLPLKQNLKLAEMGNKYRHLTGRDSYALIFILNISKKTKAFIQIY